MEDEQDVSQESSPADEVVADPSTETPEVSAEETAEQSVQEEQIQPGPVPYDRFQEVIQEKNELKQQVGQLIQKFQQPTAPAHTQQEADFIRKYGANDAQTQLFLTELDKHIEHKATQVGHRMAEPIQRENEALKRVVASLQEKQFRVENKDVPPNSAEESQISQLIRAGLPLEKATWAVMGPKRVADAQRVHKVKQQATNKTKVQATQERSSIPEMAGLPKEKLSFREQIDLGMKKAGL